MEEQSESPASDHSEEEAEAPKAQSPVKDASARASPMKSQAEAINGEHENQPRSDNASDSEDEAM